MTSAASAQEVSLDGAVVVTTPQRLSFVDVIKGIDMFDSLKARLIIFKKI